MSLVSTCHALWDGPFSRTQSTATEPAKQIGREDVERRRRHRLAVLASKVGGDPSQLLQAPGDLDWSGCNLDVNDVRALAGLCVRPPPLNKQVQATTLKLRRTSRGILIGTLVGRAETVDLRNRGLSTLECTLISVLLKFTRALTVTNLLSNQLDAEATTMLAEVAKQKGISLCGIRRDQTTADFRNKGLKLPDTILLASDLSQAVVTGALTSVDLRGNQLGDEGWGAIFAAICGNKDSKIMCLDASKENISPAGVKLIAEALRTSITGALTSVDLRGNKLRDEGWGAIFAAICGNMDSKIMSLDASSENISPAGVKLIAEALRTSVTGALTVTNLLGNWFDAKSAKMLAEVAKQKVISLCGILRDQTTTNFSNQNLRLPDAILLASDLSQAVVTGAGGSGAPQSRPDVGIPSRYVTGRTVSAGAGGSGTSILGGLTVANLLGNQLDAEAAKMLAEVAKQKGVSLCGIQRDQTTADFRNKGLKLSDAILLASDLSQAVVTGALTSVNLRGNKLRDEGWGAIFAAICGNKDSKIMCLDASSETIGPAGVKLIAEALRTSVTGGLTVIDLLYNKLDAVAAKMLAEVAKQKGVSLCGIRRDQTTADFSKQSLNLPDAILLASDLSQAVVTGGLTVANLLGNQLDAEAAKMLAEVAKQKGVSLCGIQRDQTTADFRNKGLKLSDAILLASDLSQAVVTGALTSVNLRANKLRDEGWGAIFAAICGNKDSKIMCLDASSETIGPAGVKLIAEALRTSVTGALTSVDLRANKLRDEGWGAIFAAICGNKDSKIMCLDASSETIGPAGVKLIAEALRTSVTGALTKIDVSRNFFGPEGAKVFADALRVNGGLTSLNLSSNQLCGLDYCGRGTYTAEGITAIADAMLVNGSLMVTNLLGNQLDAEAAKMLAEVAKQKGISLCGIQRDQTTADFRNKGLKLSDAILLASDLSQAVVTGALTSVNLRGNKLRDEGWGAIFAAICGNKDSKIMSLDASSETIGPAGVKLIAEALRTSVTGGLTSIDVRQNNIAGNGAVQLAAAVLGNLKIEIFNEIPIKEMRANSLTELDLNGKYVGVEAGMVVAGLIPVMGALTSLELRGNRLGDEGWGAIFAAICGNKDSKIMSLNAASENIGPAGVKLIAEALRTSVTGALMKVR